MSIRYDQIKLLINLLRVSSIIFPPSKRKNNILSIIRQQELLYLFFQIQEKKIKSKIKLRERREKEKERQENCLEINFNETPSVFCFPSQSQASVFHKLIFTRKDEVKASYFPTSSLFRSKQFAKANTATLYFSLASSDGEAKFSLPRCSIV